MWRENLRLGGSRADFGWAASLLEQHRDKIIANYRERLRAIDSPLLSCPEMEKQLELQAQAIVEDVARVFRGGIESLQRADDRISEVLGASRANQRVHPSDSLMAAVELSESILLKVTIESQSEMSTEELTLAASVIYRCTIERVAKASVSYGDYLLSKIHKSNIDERRRVSRELHDRVANSSGRCLPKCEPLQNTER